MITKPLKLAVLVDLARGENSGGHVKFWENIAAAATAAPSIDMTVYFSGSAKEESLSGNVRFRYLPPVFSTKKLKFLPYVPAHTDIASFHPALAQDILSSDYQLLHTTDAYFAFSKTAEKLSKKHGIPFSTSLHTDTPAYAETFTYHTLTSLFGRTLGSYIDKSFRISSKQKKSKEELLIRHMQAANAVFLTRNKDLSFAQEAGIARRSICNMRLGVDKNIFYPFPVYEHKLSHKRLFANSNLLAPDTFLILFVGRVDVGKRFHVLLEACYRLLDANKKFHLFVAGVGPLETTAKAALGDNVSLLGYLSQSQLANLYRSVDLLAVPSNIEIGGLVGIEALSCGCPVISSPDNGLSESLNFPGLCIQDIPSYPDVFAAAIHGLIDNRLLLRKISEAAVSFAGSSVASWGQILREDFMPGWKSIRNVECEINTCINHIRML
ncbi:MAG: glycosyltransferase [Alphaproteobacteria bacterium]|nr:glycosyltransferase [Alphaproteobacteria bacterium]MCL2504833.1 glycosyltransferase [Alphaproteobacteria bacterium]